jgi:LysM repeat protein
VGIFVKSFSEKVQDAVAAINKSGIGIHDLKATIYGTIVTLEGLADSMGVKGQVMTEFNRMVNTENTFNGIRIKEPQAVPPVPPPATAATVEGTVYVVKPGDTLGAIAQRFYGKASLCPKIFEANRDILSNPDSIKVGQKLKIPKIS